MKNKKTTDIRTLKKKAIKIRKDILMMLEKSGSGHTGGSLSLVEILVALYYYKMKHDPRNPGWQGRDRLLLSKGHGCPALYAVLADCGYFPREELWGLRKLGSPLQGHPQLGLQGIEISSGSLGQGLSIANGMALANRIDRINPKIYCIMGDGETNEGQIWEAAMTASHYGLSDVCGIVDFNKLQIDGFCCDVKGLEPYAKKWQSFGWHTLEIDGHDFKALINALDEADKVIDKPKVLIAHTVKGKGVSFIENRVEWHGIAPKKDELEKALTELNEELKKC
ncbi:MAG: transketolase [Omnitrophica bacterium]|nr:transketolase [Candidatus Omnitrophota bacterium]